MTCRVYVRNAGPGWSGAASPVIRPSKLPPSPPFVPGIEATILGHDGEHPCRLVWNDRALPVTIPPL